MVNHEPKNGIPWQWKYKVELTHHSQDFHKINKWLDTNIGSEDWSDYEVGNNIGSYTSSGPCNERKSVYLFNKKEHAILFKTVWVI